MANKKEEIIQTAIQLEKDGRQFYLDSAAKALNTATNQMFESLAEDESKHIEWIKNLSTDGVASGSANKQLYGKLQGIFAEVPKSVREQFNKADDDIKAMKLAIDMEAKAQVAYKDWAEKTDDSDIKQLCLTLADMERFHRELLENAIEYLNNTSDWFMKEENWIFDGG